MHIKFYDWNASIKYERINWYNSRFDKNGHSMIKTTINFTDLALKTLRKNVNIPLPSDNGCMCLHPKEQSRLRLSNDSDHSLIDTIGRALLTLLGGNFELPLQIRTRDNKRYVIKWIRFICKNVYMLFQRRWLQEKTTHVLHFNNLLVSEITQTSYAPDCINTHISQTRHVDAVEWKGRNWILQTFQHEEKTISQLYTQFRNIDKGGE